MPLSLDIGANRPILVITGPNTGGKTVALKTIGLLALLNQSGIHIPANKETSIPVFSGIYADIGDQQSLQQSVSSFSSHINSLNDIIAFSDKDSLVILDEIGRGTSTYDGLAIARSVIEHIHNDPRLGCKTLFATHYHELTNLSTSLPGVRNCSVAVTEEKNSVVFLHKIVPGGADKSYGVHVAQLAGLPHGVVNRAWEVLADLESASLRNYEQKIGQPKKEKAQQIALFNDGVKLQGLLKELDIPNLTPLEAINKLYELQQTAEEEL